MSFGPEKVKGDSADPAFIFPLLRMSASIVTGQLKSCLKLMRMLLLRMVTLTSYSV